jgi:cell fate regulator YaaT (PSP1 superfamily)
MPQTVEVRFKGTRRDFYSWPDDQEPLRLREAVVVELDRGQDLGRVHTAGEVAEKKCGGGCTSCAVGEGIHESAAGGTAVATGEEEPAGEVDGAEEAGEDASETVGVSRGEASSRSEESSAPPTPSASSLRAVLRRATQEDIRLSNELRISEENVRRQVLEKVRQHKLDMKVSDAEWQWDRAKLSVYFTAEKRVDFRALVRDLASLFRTRIELRQIGVRDEAARLTGVGRCGREYCCSTWLKELSPVSLALAKDQHLSLNPAQISGGCGRLLCCLKYEHEFYVASRRRFPREGKALDTSLGKEKVVAVDIFRERVFLRSEEHGPRIIPLVQLKEEMETAAASAPATITAPTETGQRRPASAPPSPQRRAPDRRGPAPERRQRADRQGGPGTVARQDTRPEASPPVPPPVPAAPVEEKTATAQNAAEGQKRSRRRRRGRRGRGGQGGGAAPGSPPAPEA